MYPVDVPEIQVEWHKVNVLSSDFFDYKMLFIAADGTFMCGWFIHMDVSYATLESEAGKFQLIYRDHDIYYTREKRTSALPE